MSTMSKADPWAYAPPVAETLHGQPALVPDRVKPMLEMTTDDGPASCRRFMLGQVGHLTRRMHDALNAWACPPFNLVTADDQRAMSCATMDAIQYVLTGHSRATALWNGPLLQRCRQAMLDGSHGVLIDDLLRWESSAAVAVRELGTAMLPKKRSK